MDACIQCPYWVECNQDPNFPCFLDSPDESDFWSSIGRSDD